MYSRKLIKAFRKFIIGLLAFLMVAVGFTDVSSAASSDTATVTGHGWGHGRGMGQYGALGYARQGWTSKQILNHYYSNTTSGNPPTNGPVDPDAVRVNLLFVSGETTTVDLESGTISISSVTGQTLASYKNQAVRLVLNGNGFDIQVASSCSGPWTKDKTVTNRSALRIKKSSNAAGKSGLLKVCGSSRSVWYSGYVEATRSTSGYPRTVNVVDVEQYLRGVVPNESPASWDAAALQSQSVAARSYVLAGDNRYPYSNTCDTARCQVYDGLYTTRGGLRSSTHANTDAAIKATANTVRLTSSNKVARTEFSSSTGGYTAGGDFPAVPDDGDSVSSNPNNSWTTTVDLSKLDKYGKGRVNKVKVVKRNGLGADGGRALEVEYHFNSSILTVTGNQTRLDFGLKSDWFSFDKSDISVNTEQPETVDTSMDDYVKKVFIVFQGREPNSSELAKWRIKALNSGKKQMALELSQDGYFTGKIVDGLYVSALGRKSDPAGKAYWLEEMADGLEFEKVGVYFYGSEEYYKIAGSSDEKFVDSLYKKLLLRDPDQSGKEYWMSLLNRNRISNPGVVDSFYQSRESRIKRSASIYRTVTKKSISSAEAESFAQRLLKIDDVELAAEIAAESFG